MIQLFQFPGYWGLSSASPFCIKMETYLKLANIPYKSVVSYHLKKAPKGKLPYIIDGEKKIADSTLIIQYLKSHNTVNLDKDLTPEQIALATTIQRLCEEHLFWILMYERWIPESGWKVIGPIFFSKLPIILKLFVPTIIRKKIKRACYEQGIGRFTDEERFFLGKQDIDAIVTLLGTKPFFFGDKPTTIDATLYGFITPILNTPIDFPLRDYAKKIKALTDYDQRMKKLL
ncbi:MAG: glutathione S-transferase C-terminal domain-containing protein [Gammaproteobacteria bacterium]|nr:glutathione S-transferase C-terminal domain-containing protein [Gammaproteobacteria bacterium]